MEGDSFHEEVLRHLGAEDPELTGLWEEIYRAYRASGDSPDATRVRELLEEKRRMIERS